MPDTKFFYVTVQMTYEVEVEAETADEAEEIVMGMSHSEIAKHSPCNEFEVTNVDG